MSNTSIRPLLVFACFLFAANAFCAAQELQKGLSYSFRSSYDGDYMSIYILEVDPQYFDVVSGKSEGNELETVAAIAQRHQAVAAVNGGFFKKEGQFADLPMGILKIDQEWCASPHKSRGAIGWSKADQKVLFDQVLTSVTAEIDGQAFKIDGINRIRQDDKIILYNKLFHPTTCTKTAGVELLIKDQQVCEIGQENMAIPSDGVVLSVGPLRVSELPPVWKGSPFAWNVQIIPQSEPPYTASEEWDNAANIVGGAPILVRAGQVLTDFSLEQTLDGFLYNKFARTAIGLLPNGHWIFVVVEGKKHFILENAGITIPSLAAFMSGLGCVEALNLCGGGTSTMVINGQVLNKSRGEGNELEKQERKVSDAILIIKK